jgi:hypothetical protein
MEGGASLHREVIRIRTSEVLEPAAAETGLRISYPRVGPIRHVGSRT